MSVPSLQDTPISEPQDLPFLLQTWDQWLNSLRLNWHYMETHYRSPFTKQPISHTVQRRCHFNKAVSGKQSQQPRNIMQLLYTAKHKQSYWKKSLHGCIFLSWRFKTCAAYIIIFNVTAQNVKAIGTSHCPLFQLMRTDMKGRTSHNRVHVYLETQHSNLWENRQADAASYHTAKMNRN